MQKKEVYKYKLTILLQHGLFDCPLRMDIFAENETQAIRLGEFQIKKQFGKDAALKCIITKVEKYA